MINIQLGFGQGDTPCSATNLTVNPSCSYNTYSNGGATYQNDAANGGTPTCASPGAPDVWFKFTAPASGTVIIDTDVGTISDAGMSLYSATNCSTAITQITCDDDGSSNGLMSKITASGLTPGATYYIRFWQYASGTGSFGICVQDNTPSPNDNPCSATTLTVGATCVYTSSSTNGATYSNTASNGGTPSCASPGSPDVWFKFVAPVSGNVWMDSQSGTITDGAMSVYSASTCNTGLTELECDDDDGTGLMAFISYSGMIPGNTYYIRFWEYSSGTGTFGICVQTPPPPVADFTGSATSFCRGSTIIFSDASTNSPTSWSWTFAGGTPASSTAQNPSVTYNVAGTYSVILTVSNSNGSDSETKTNYVTVNNCPPSSQDCINAIPICLNSYSEISSFTGTGNITPEINSTNSCLLSGEKNDVWYIFTVLNSGNVNFLITPNNATDDYDWAVFDLSSSNCADIYNDPLLEVSCNYASKAGTTGPNGGSVFTSQGSGGTPYNAVIPVITGQTYVINVSQFTASVFGYTINFSSSTATIVDNTVPQLLNVITPINCGSNTVTFNFTENVLCSTVSTSDFTLTGPGGPYSITAINGPACAIGGNFENTFTITVSPGLLSSGTYSVNLTGSVTDNCSNVAPATSKSFAISGVTIAISSQTDVICPCEATGSATVSGSGGTSPYSYSWSIGSTTSTISGVSAGDYTVTVTDSKSCNASQTISITEPPAITITLNSQSNISCFGLTNGSIQVSASGGVGPYDFSIDGGSTYTFNNIAGGTPVTFNTLPPGAYVIKVRDGNNCVTSP